MISVIVVAVLRYHEPCPYVTMNLIDKCCVCSDCSTNWPSLPVSLPLLRPPYFLRHNNIEIRPINNPTTAFKHSGKIKSHMSLTLNLKLEIIMLSEECMSKTEMGESWASCTKHLSQVMNAKEKSLQGIKIASIVNM